MTIALERICRNYLIIPILIGFPEITNWIHRIHVGIFLIYFGMYIYGGLFMWGVAVFATTYIHLCAHQDWSDPSTFSLPEWASLTANQLIIMSFKHLIHWARKLPSSSLPMPPCVPDLLIACFSLAPHNVLGMSCHSGIWNRKWPSGGNLSSLAWFKTNRCHDNILGPQA